jgi:hypothetical protein
MPAIIALLLCGLLLGCGRSEERRLTLRLEQRYPLPAAIRIAGISSAQGRSTFAAWEGGRGKAYLLQDAGLSEIPLLDKPLAGIALNKVGDRLYLLYEDGTVQGLDRDFRQLMRRELAIQRTVAVTSTHDHWFVVTRGAKGRLMLSKHDLEGLEIKATALPTEPSREKLHLRADSEVVVVANALFPFGSIVLDSSLSLVGRLESVDEPFSRATPASDTLRSWVALPVVRIPGGYLQTLADPRSDNREFRWYADDGSVRKVRKLSASLGVIASQDQNVFAVRRTRLLELLRYKVEQ